MANINELKELIDNTESGSVVRKKINHKDYYYYQYYKLNTTKSVYVAENDLAEVYDAVIKRDERLSKTKEELSHIRDLPSLSQNSKELTGYLMMGDEVVASYNKGELIYIDEDKCPLLIKRTHNVSLFLSSRVIDAGRTNARLLKKTLGIKTSNDVLIAQYSYGATISDNYWFKPLYSKLKYDDICFNNDFYGDLALNGSFKFLPRFSKHTPQLTLPGSFEKCWKKENGEWWLYKKGNSANNFSEVFVSKLAKEISIPTVIYKLSEGYVKTKNFADKYNFEPMMSIAGDDDSYENVFKALKPYSKEIKKAYLKLIYLDTIVYNVDRHNENCGLLRDRKSGRIVSLAPNFDNNLALKASGTNLKTNSSKDSLMRLFIKFIKNDSTVKSLIKEIEFKSITRPLLQKIYNSIQIEDKDKDVIEFVFDRYLYLQKEIEKII